MRHPPRPSRADTELTRTEPRGLGDDADGVRGVDLTRVMAKLTEEPRYETVSSIGAGGMGEIRLCLDRRVGREVAMKLIHQEHGSQSDARLRFLREARVQGQLEHPAVVPVYDLGASDEGPYFTMKRIRGMTLEEILEALRDGDPDAQRTYPLRRRLAILDTVCLAVAFAHARGVLHRDLKPANIMVGAFGEVHVLDWGLAKIMGAPDDMAEQAAVTRDSADGDSETGATAAGELMGTPGYMSPEQVTGEWDRVDARTDVYSLGAILFESLTLARLHRGANVAELLTDTLKGADARPSARAPDVDVAPELEALCVRATALRPDDRFASAAELAEALERFLDGDRDEERRRQMADTHAESALAAAERVLSGDSGEEERRAALREAGAALALSPSHPVALRTLARLLLTPPKELPADARDEFDAHVRVVERTARRGATIQYAAWLGFAPVVLTLGVLDWTLFWSAVGLVVVATLAAWATYRLELGERAKLGVYCLGAAFAALASTCLGPLILVPNLAVTNVLAYCLYGGPRYRPLAVAIAALAVVGPLTAQLVGLLPTTYAFTDQGMLIRPVLTTFPEVPTLLLLTVASLSLVIPPALFAGRVRDTVSNAEKRSFLERWNLRQLLPEDPTS